MRTRSANIPVVTAFICSIALHVVLLLPAFHTALRSGGPDSTARQLDAEAAPDIADEVRLGLDDAVTSSLTWVGHREYEEHLARLSDVEQAEFRDQDDVMDAVTSELPENPVAEPDVVEPVDQAEPAEPVDAPDPADDVADDSTVDQPSDVGLPDDADPTDTPVDDPLLDDDALIEPVDPHAAAPDPDAEPTFDQPEPVTMLPRGMPDPIALAAMEATLGEVIDAFEREAQRLRVSAQRVQESIRRSMMQSMAGAMRELTDAQRVTDPPDDPSARADDAQASATGATVQPPTGGDRSGRESPATSTIDVPPSAWRAGRPLAGEGIELLPRRPQFETWTRITARIVNPLCEIEFDRTGVPPRARVVDPSGDDRVDAAILASLYGWRARGRQIDDLAEGETVTIPIRFILIRE